MTILFTVLFFAGVLGVALAILWSVVDENLDKVLDNMPWKARRNRSAPQVTVRRAAFRQSAY